jgi:tetratricopeptide (TPR) repeat protein
MKKLTWGLIGIGLAAAAVIVTVKWKGNPLPPAEAVVQAERNPAPNLNGPPNTSVASVNAPEPAEEHHNVPESAMELAEVSSAAAPPRMADPAESAAKPAVAATFSQPLQTLVSSQASYAQKQAAWKQLYDTHQLDQAIADLEQAAKAEPSVAGYPAALGQAYLQKLRTTQDTREKVMLAMKADLSFDQALNLDQSNWEARFWKASSLSYWPAELNKSEEVMQNLATLVEQQETQSPQPHFAQTYVLLGEQYQKAGSADDARQIWQRGARLFPDNNTLREKLAGLP